ncbi:hypothetical protein MKZ38_007678 [Zalerion maritima]|uniref:Histone chaperone RTT106/FACT complex subunit SPT16-like middle domain-containing protein n=1 Tax=Zalerion maritima TaxID=339359 RepID=A0AAD5RYZ5_9PEZI|nr:hypothetical protein MKZ38_007678 [Zalerion maritima]
MAGLNSQRLEAVFQSRPDIIQGIVKAAAPKGASKGPRADTLCPFTPDSPVRVRLFNEIANHVYDQLNGSEPVNKKRKLDGSGASVSNGNGAVSTAADLEGEQIILEIKDISVTIPQRKKFDLCFTSKHLFARSGGVPVQGIIYAWKDIEYSFYLPVPEKTQPQFNYILMPKGTALLGLAKNAPTGVAEPLVFTVPAGAPKPGTLGGSAAATAGNFSDSFSTLFHWSLSANLPHEARLMSANPDKFKSAVRQGQRPKEPAVHVKAFRGSKEGFLFFLDDGIMWGYKKPLLFIPLTSIAAVSYCNVLRTTFNMVVEVFAPGPAGEDNTEEVEFGMIDQADYPGIDEKYVKRKGLQDQSLAEQRKAKKELAENEKGSKKSGDDEMVVDGEEANANGRTILEQAQWEEEQRLQDEEDEDEEDYDPGNDGESEGSGSDDDDDEDDDDDDDDDGQGGDD